MPSGVSCKTARRVSTNSGYHCLCDGECVGVVVRRYGMGAGAPGSSSVDGDVARGWMGALRLQRKSGSTGGDHAIEKQQNLTTVASRFRLPPRSSTVSPSVGGTGELRMHSLYTSICKFSNT